MRYLYYCNSAYQLLNAINLHYNRSFNNFEDIDSYEGDLLLVNVFNGVEEIVEILNNNKTFNQIFIGNRVYKKGKFHVIKNIFDIIFPGNFIYKANGIKKAEIYNKYNYIVTPKFSTLIAAVWRLNKNAKIQLYEDGIGAYHSTLLNPNSNTYKVLYKLFNRGKTFNDYECLYLNCPSLYIEKNSKIKQMPKLPEFYLNYLSSLFGLFNFNVDKRIIWFDQYINDNINNETMRLLSNYKDDVIYCPHPRHPKDYESFVKPNNKQIWEIACLGLNDINNKCLVTIHSTAVFTPKLLYGLEPYIIFTVKLLKNYEIGSVECNGKLKVIERFKKMYSNPFKIMVPSSLEEYEQCVANFINNK